MLKKNWCQKFMVESPPPRPGETQDGQVQIHSCVRRMKCLFDLTVNNFFVKALIIDDHELSAISEWGLEWYQVLQRTTMCTHLNTNSCLYRQHYLFYCNWRENELMPHTKHTVVM